MSTMLSLGDQNQRYVIYADGYPREGEHIIGYTEALEDAERMAEGIQLAPSCKASRIFDRKGTEVITGEALRLFMCNKFMGHWPTGVGAIMIASNIESAKDMLEDALVDAGLSQKIKLEEIKEVSLHEASVHILADGNY